MSLQHAVSIVISSDATIDELAGITVHEWLRFPTLAIAQDSDLKYSGDRYRVWCSRMTIEDYDGNADAYLKERVQYEELIDGRWTLLDRYGRLS